MTQLKGVGDAVASALLMVWNPDEYTVIDVRAVNSLVKNGLIEDPAPDLYPPPHLVRLRTCLRGTAQLHYNYVEHKVA